MVVSREIRAEFQALLKQYPVVTLTGPRQSGKTTLVQTACPKMDYYTLEDPDTRAVALADPRAFLSGHTKGVILDEIQRAPELLSYIQGITDKEKRHGMYVLTGSQQMEILNKVTQSLAGRTALLKLLPFSMKEAGQFRKRMTADEWLFTGFYPRIYDKRLSPNKAYRNYFETYVERDLRQLIQVKDLLQFQKFVKLCAGRIGQIFNASSFSNEIGVSVPTINSWLSILQASYIVFLLQPYYGNFGKRLVKSPKLYFHDPGLASYLLGIEEKPQLASHPLRGSLFENLVIIEMMKSRYNRGLDHNLFFYRDSNGNEVDVIYTTGASVVPVEIKSAGTFTTEFLKGLHHVRKVIPGAAGGWVVYSGQEEYSIDGCNVLHFSNVRRIVDRTR